MLQVLIGSASLSEVPQRGTSNEYTQHIFSRSFGALRKYFHGEIRKISVGFVGFG